MLSKEPVIRSATGLERLPGSINCTQFEVKKPEKRPAGKRTCLLPGSHEMLSVVSRLSNVGKNGGCRSFQAMQIRLEGEECPIRRPACSTRTRPTCETRKKRPTVSLYLNELL